MASQFLRDKSESWKHTKKFSNQVQVVEKRGILVNVKEKEKKDEPCKHHQDETQVEGQCIRGWPRLK